MVLAQVKEEQKAEVNWEDLKLIVISFVSSNYLRLIQNTHHRYSYVTSQISHISSLSKIIGFPVLSPSVSIWAAKRKTRKYLKVKSRFVTDTCIY